MILKPTLYLMSEKLMRLGLGFLAGSLIARTLGAEEFGNLSFVMAVYLIIEPVSQLGLQGLYKKYYLDEQIPKTELIATTILLRVLTSFLFGIILFAYSYLFIEDLTLRSILFLFCPLFFLKSFEIVEWTKEAELELKKITLFKFFVFFVTFLFRLYGVWQNKGIEFFAVAFVLEYLLLFLLYFFWLKKREFKIFFSKAIASLILKNCWPLVISGLAVTIYMKIDQLMIKHFLDSKELGIYSASVRISELLNFFPLAMSTIFFPLWLKRDKEIIINSFSLMTYISVAASIFVYFFAEFIITIVYGPEYLASAQVLRLHIFSMIFVFWGVMVGNFDILINRTDLSMYRTIAGALLNIVLNLILIPKLGTYGAALGTLISYSFTVFFFNFFFKNIRVINLYILRSFHPRHLLEIIYEFSKR